MFLFAARAARARRRFENSCGPLQGSSQLATCNPIRQREGVAAGHVDVIVPEWEEASDILVAGLAHQKDERCRGFHLGSRARNGRQPG
jgi:hypothetical protein